MSLVELANNSRTDKNTLHSYLPLYDTLLFSKKLTAKNVLEVGIFLGGSIKLWSDYFPNAIVNGVDIMKMSDVWDDIKNNDGIVLFTCTDAYDNLFLQKTFIKKNIKFDFVIDDGPHTLYSQIKFIQLYSQVLADDGILIIEDVQDIGWLDILKTCTPDDLKPYIKTFDLRNNKNRYDDIVFVIDKNNIFRIF